MPYDIRIEASERGVEEITITTPKGGRDRGLALLAALLPALRHLVPPPEPGRRQPAKGNGSL